MVGFTLSFSGRITLISMPHIWLRWAHLGSRSCQRRWDRLIATLADLLQADPKTLQPVVTATNTRPQVQRCARYPATFRCDVQQELQHIAASEQYPPVSLSAVTRRFSCHRRTLRQCNPAACDVISARYQAYMHQKKEQRLRDMGEKFRIVGRQFRSQGIAFSHRQVARHLAQRRLFSSKEVRDLFRQVRLELEREISLV